MPRLPTPLRWIVATALAGAAVGLAGGAGLGGTATLLLPGLALGLAQRIAMPDRLPPVWTLFSGLAWVAGALLDASLPLRPAGAGLWLVPTATMAIWQTFLINDVRTSWPWLPVSLLGALVLQLAAQAACAVGCRPVAYAFGPSAATVMSYLVGFAGYGLVTGAALPWLLRPRAVRSRA